MPAYTYRREAPRTENIGEALFRGLSEGASAIPGAVQQQKENNLKDIVTGLQFIQEQRQQKESAARMAQFNTQNKIANFQYQQAVDAAGKTNEERGRDKAEEQFGQLQGLALSQGVSLGHILHQSAPELTQSIAGGLAPGSQVNVGGFNIQGAPFPKQFAPQDDPKAVLDLFKAKEKVTTDENIRQVKETAGITKGTPKTLSAKDQEYKSILSRDYPEDVSNRLWSEYVSGVDASAKQKEYHRVLNEEVGGGLFGKQATPEARAEAARRTKFSPQYGMTKDQMIDRIKKRLKAGEITEAFAKENIAIAERHWDNLYDEVVDYFAQQ